MQQGIQSLMPQGPQQGPQQGPMPGQAPQMPMPGMMPQPSAPTPQAMVGPLTQMHLQQLTQLMLNPRPDGPPLYAVLTAINEKQKQAQAQANMQRQMAMAQGQQAAQQPPIAQQVLAQAQQMEQAEPEEPDGYAGGGAVAFQYGGATLPRLTGESDEDYAIRISSLPQQPGETDRQYQRRIYSGVTRGKDVIAPELPLTAQQRERQQATELQQASQAAPGYASGIDAVLAAEKARQQGATRNLGTGQRPPAAPAAAPTDTGLAGLMGPTVEPERLAMRGAVDERQAAIRNAAKTPEDVLKARGGIDALMKEIVDSRRAEEQRLMTHSDKRLEEARARAAQSPLTDISYLGQMLEGMRGSKRFGEALAGAAAGAGRAQTARSQALQAAEDKYELSRRDIFNLANLRQQVQLDQAKLIEARASGEADKANKAALDLAQSKEALAKFEMDVSNKSREFGLEERKLTQQAQLAREQMANLMALERIRQNASKPERDMITRAESLKLDELTKGKPGDATPAQKLEALTFALNTVKGAGRAESVEAQDRRTAIRALTDWEKETGSRLRMMNSKNPEVYANAKKEEIERIKRVFGIDLSVSPATGGAVDTSNPLLK